MNAISINKLSKSFNNFKLCDISFCLPKGYICGLVGENGAGKTTTIKLILNALKADSGKISVLGTQNTDVKFSEIKQDIGVVFDQAYFPLVLNAKNIDIIMKGIYRNWSSSLYYSYLKQFNLPLDKQFKDFSKGMKMKLSIAVALSHDAKLLILDEATSGLDPVAREEILDILAEFTRDENNSILFSSHITSDLEKICDYIVFLKNGSVVFHEQKDLLFEKYCFLKLSEQDASALSSQSVVAKKKRSYGFDILAKKHLVPKNFTSEYFTLEDIILMMSKDF